MNKTALLIGSGIGGPVLAMALQKAGITPVLYEAQTGSAEFVGSFLNLASNGLAVLRSLGLSADLWSDGFPTPRMVMFNGAGKALGTVSNGRVEADGTRSITIKRGLLHRALRDEAVRRGVRLEVGRRLVEVLGTTARFEDGSEASGDWIIGADGLHSRVRQLIDGKAPPPRYTGQLSIGGVAAACDVAPTPEEYRMIFGRRAFFGYSVRRSGEAYWFANLAADASAARELPKPALKSTLLELFSGDAGPACELINATSDELGAYPIYDMPTVPRWHRESMVLIGDSAHATSPSSGQGASMAIEDAVVLAKCLGASSTPFEEYERLRRARVEKVVRYSARVGSTKVPGPVGRFFRDLFMPVGLKLLASSKANDWLYTPVA